MWKPGQTVSVNGKRYRVTKCHAIKQSMVCMVCARENIGTPCLESNNYPSTKEPFSVVTFTILIIVLNVYILFSGHNSPET